MIGAGEGNRTLVISLEGCCSTIELHPHRPHTLRALAALGQERCDRFSREAAPAGAIRRSSKHLPEKVRFVDARPAFALRATARQPSLASPQKSEPACRAVAREASERWWGRQDSNLRRL